MILEISHYLLVVYFVFYYSVICIKVNDRGQLITLWKKEQTKVIELKNMKMKRISKYYLIIYKILRYNKLKLSI